MTTKATLEVNLKDTDLGDVTTDIRKVTRFALEISAVFNELAQGSKTVNKTTVNHFTDDLSRKLAVILEHSMNASYKCDVGLLYGSLIDRVAISGQAAVKLFSLAHTSGKRKYVREYQQLDTNIQKIFSLFTNLSQLENETGEKVYPVG